MKRKILSLALGCLMLMAVVPMLAGCSGAKIADKYTNVDDSSIYLTFDGNKVTLYEGGSLVYSGTFTESAKSSSGYLLRIKFEKENAERFYWLDESKETIFDAINAEDRTTSFRKGEQ